MSASLFWSQVAWWVSQQQLFTSLASVKCGHKDLTSKWFYLCSTFALPYDYISDKTIQKHILMLVTSFPTVDEMPLSYEQSMTTQNNPPNQSYLSYDFLVTLLQLSQFNKEAAR